MFKQWKKKVNGFVEQNEIAVTALLLIIALALIVIAVYGKPQHKAAAMLYIVL